MGQLVLSVAKPHRHDAPKNPEEEGIAEGSIWLCDCGQYLLYKGWDYGYWWKPIRESVAIKRIEKAAKQKGIV